jgi:hypothetical protein
MTPTATLKKIIRPDSRASDNTLYWVEFPTCGVEICVDPTERFKGDDGSDVIHADVYDCTAGSLGEFLFTEEIKPADWKAKRFDSLDDLWYFRQHG